MTESMHRKCFFRQMKLCDILKESGLCRGSPTGGEKSSLQKVIIKWYTDVEEPNGHYLKLK